VLGQVPLDQLGESQLAGGAVNGTEAREVLLAAASPSDQEYWVPDKGYPDVSASASSA
jgi:hypothetical protein